MVQSALFLSATALVACVLGLALQSCGRFVFRRHGRTDTRDYAAVLGLRIAALFSIVVGLIVNSTYEEYADTRRALLAETSTLGTLHSLAGTLPPARATETRAQIATYLGRVIDELTGKPQDHARMANSSQELYSLCERSPGDPDGAWALGEYQRACSALVDLRGQRLGRLLEDEQERLPLAVFLFTSLAALALLLGVFERTRLHLALGAMFYLVAGLTFALIYGMSEPFHGPLAIDAAPLLQLAREFGME
jgi:hypothetical protein